MERLLDYFVPEHYDLALNIDKKQRKISGEVAISGEALAGEIKLHAKKIHVTSLTVEAQVKTPTTDEKNDLLIISGVKKGATNIKICFDFDLTENMQGAYLSKYKHKGKTEWIVATQFESHYARECFPCIDEPAAKATFKLSISADADDTVISNMPELGEAHLVSSNFLLHNFATTPKMSTYLLAFAVGKFHKITGKTEHGVDVATYAALNQPKTRLEFANDFAIKCLDFYNKLFDTNYPLPKLDQLALPDFEAGAMENWGLVTYREQALLVDKKSAEDQKLYVATVIAHELSHQWFGNLVTMQWWDDLWLNESFATLIETYAVDKIDPKLGAWDDFYEGTVLSALRRDCLPGVQSVKCQVSNPSDIASIFDGAIVYAKGGRLLLMLMRLMGERNFFKGLKDYFKKHAYQNTVSDDLWDALTPHADFNVKDFMTPWLLQSGYPVVTDDLQQRFLICPSDEPNYEYPIKCVCDDLSGHYLINLSSDEFLQSLDAFVKKNKEQKLRLLIDRDLLSKTPLVDSSTLLPLLEKFKSETEYIIWSILSLVVADLKIFLSAGSDSEAKFKLFVADLAKEQYLRLGLTAKANESKNDINLRPIILNLMLYSENQEFLESIKKTFGQILPSRIDANIRASVLVALVRQNPETNSLYAPEKLLKAYTAETDPNLRNDLMAAVTSSYDQEFIKRCLSKLTDGSVRPQDRLFFVIRMLRNNRISDLVFDWFYQNWEKLYQEEGDKTISDYPRLAASVIRTEDVATKFKNFFASKTSDPALSRDLKIAFAEIDARLELVKNDAKNVQNWLKNYK